MAQSEQLDMQSRVLLSTSLESAGPLTMAMGSFLSRLGNGLCSQGRWEHMDVSTFPFLHPLQFQE